MPQKRAMKIPKNLGMLVLAIYLILVGIIPLFAPILANASLPDLTILALLELIAGILILIGQYAEAVKSRGMRVLAIYLILVGIIYVSGFSLGATSLLPILALIAGILILAGNYAKRLKRIGIFLLITGFLVGIMFRFISGEEMNEELPLLPFLMIPGGAFLYWRGRQYAAQMDAERIITDSKPDVLYLRAFVSDPSTAGNVLSSMLTVRLMSGLATEEEQLADVLRPFGDLVAIGQPGEGLPKPGATRIYASDEEWKKVVKRQMRTAPLVVIRAGSGENLLWELQQAAETVSPHKVLILVLNMKAEHYESFRAKATGILGVSLPATLRRHGRVSGFIGFAADWKPSFFALRAPYFRRSVFRPYRRLFKFALRPVFESFGLEWQPPPVSAATVSGIAVLALLGLLILLGITISFLGS